MEGGGRREEGGGRREEGGKREEEGGGVQRIKRGRRKWRSISESCHACFSHYTHLTCTTG